MNWCFQTVVLEKTLENLLDYEIINAVSPKGNQPRIFIGRLLLKLKLQYFGQLMQRANSLEKTLMHGKIEAKTCASCSGSALWPVLFWEVLVSLLSPSHPRRLLLFPWVAGSTVESGREPEAHYSETSDWWCFYSPPSPASLLCSLSSIPLAHPPAATRLPLASCVAPAFLDVFLPKSCLRT